jgi:hypothetical protein
MNSVAPFRPMFLCPLCRAGICDWNNVYGGKFYFQQFLCPLCRAGICDRCRFPRVLTCGFGAARAILTEVIEARIVRALPEIEQTRLDLGFCGCADRGDRWAGAAGVYTGHVMIQKSWRSSMTRAPITATPRTAVSSSG